MWWVLIALIIAFLAGGVIGGFLTILILAGHDHDNND